MMILNFFKTTAVFAICFFIVNPTLATQWTTNSYYLKKNYSQVRDFENYMFTPLIRDEGNFDDEEENQSSVTLRTYSILIVKNGQIIYEKYDRGHTKNRPQRLLSISKSITNLLIGIAINENLISIEDNLCKYFGDYEKIFKCHEVTVGDLLSWSSGIHWREHFNNPLDSSAFNLIYNSEGYRDSTSFILSHPLIRKPGSSWHYSSADSNLLMSLLSRVYPSEQYAALPWVKLFNKIGIKGGFWDQDKKGIFNGCCSLYLTAREMARIGDFIIKNGVWNGQQLLPSGWVQDYIQTIPPSFLKDPVLIEEQIVPSHHWWVNQMARHGNVFVPRGIPDAPNDLIVAIGYAGQFLFIIPSMKTVIVRTGDTAGNYLDINAMVGMALNIIRGKSYIRPIRTKPIPFSIGREYDSPRNYQGSALKIANNFVAKEICSCLFIEKANYPSCLDNLSVRFNNIPSISVSTENKMVEVKSFGFFFSSKAYYRGRYGCLLQ